jgi:hypothetical protein
MTIEKRDVKQDSQHWKSVGQVPGGCTERVAPIRQAQGSHSRKKVLCWIGLLPLLTLAPQARANLITNGSFESVTPALSTNGICTTDPAVYPAADPGDYPACFASGWTGDYQIGNGATIGFDGVSFGIPQPDPSGSNALILQAELDLAPTATQSVDIPTAGLYTLTFYVANRSTPAADDEHQTVSVLLDGAAITGGTYGDLPAAWTLETLTFSASAGSHSLTLEGMDETSGVLSANVTAFVDDVSLAPEAASTPEPSTYSLIGLALIALATAVRLTRHRCAV